MTSSPLPKLDKEIGAYLTIGELAQQLGVEQHVLRYWESKFPQIKPLKRAGGRRYYSPQDAATVKRIQAMLYHEGYTIRGAQKAMSPVRGDRTHAATLPYPSSPEERPEQSVSEQNLNSSAPTNMRPDVPPDVVQISKSRLEALLGQLSQLRRLVHG